jgi:hypothetical protein
VADDEQDADNDQDSDKRDDPWERGARLALGGTIGRKETGTGRRRRTHDEAIVTLAAEAGSW